MNRGTGQIHWSAKGSFQLRTRGRAGVNREFQVVIGLIGHAWTYPISERSVIVALATPELIKIPTPQQKLTSETEPHRSIPYQPTITPY